MKKRRLSPVPHFLHYVFVSEPDHTSDYIFRSTKLPNHFNVQPGNGFKHASEVRPMETDCIMSLIAELMKNKPQAASSEQEMPGQALETSSLDVEKIRSLAETRPHPRLFLSEKELSINLTRLKEAKDKNLLRIRDDVTALSNRLIDAPPLHREVMDGRLLAVSKNAMERIYAHAAAWRYTGDEKHLKAGIRDLLTVSHFPDWNWEHSLDMAEMVNAVGFGYDWLYEGLDEEQRETIRKSIVEYALKPTLHSWQTEPGPRWTNWILRHYNWNLVCNGGCLVGAAAVAETDPEYLAELIPFACRSMRMAVSSFGEDGFWGEGPSYWSYALQYVAYAGAALESIFDHDFSLTDHPGVKKSCAAFIATTGPSGKVFNMADTGQYFKTADLELGTRRTAMFEFFWAALKFNDSQAALSEHETLRKTPASPQHLIWYVPRPHSVSRVEKDARFGGPVDVVTFRQSHDRDALFVVAKGGFNSINHGHLDLGSFELDVFGKRWFVDPGKEDYALPGYWDRHTDTAQRWKYFRLGSRGHCVPLIDGSNQLLVGRGDLVKYRSSTDEAFAVFELSSAYALWSQSVHRGIKMLDSRRRLLIQDEFVGTANRRLTWNSLTPANISLDGKTALLEMDGAALELRALSPANPEFTSEPVRIQPPETPVDGLRHLWLHTDGCRDKTTIAVLVTPLTDETSAPIGRWVVPLYKW